MSEVNSLIAIQGTDADIFMETKGDVGAYGDREVSWDKVGTEKVIVQLRRRGKEETLAGRFNECEYLGIFKSNSIIQENNYLLVDSAKYEVAHMRPIRMFNKISHHEAFLKILTEG